MDYGLAERFERERPRLRAVAYRLLGSLTDAEDAVQETWLRLARTDPAAVDNLDAWLTTVVARVSLNALRSRAARREDPLDVRLPDPVVDADDPAHAAVLADSVGLALLVVLDTLSPAERLAFVLHDMFGVPFDEIGPLVDRSPAAARQLASRARRRVRGQAPTPDPDLTRQRAVVDAFLAAARDGDLDALIAVLHPDVVLRSDAGTARARHTVVLTGATTVAAQATTFGRLFPHARPVLVNGAAGVLVSAGDRPLSVMAFTVTGGRIAAVDVIADPRRLAALGLTG
ncbi:MULTISPECIES: RNA polymerase sigma factor SigJ [unclassified Micromonospora]|uniref:RNA polymerase sigma factor SigJ n=1 Tax=unclassified Micromonospora TaxID=2617518 RepID=UPI0005B8D9D5|nr:MULTISPECIES: RNA polymerase sigma factor SigJ [unclassified Micromonospora]MCK1806731.1 RNA polymerase sigma factor SigJ [Micromonospora sp. R42106]MCK1832380.1 RNA polymerase sigma factor SigJ [Micromonospora sp. R42003]MCK1843743.1 RNA polymerase sigma factor SigJ [Micromonospora sp. R42004]MCM1017307.1 RNA polymerase sigma factor SigJ [Micromonospora sp. XM-20-01]